MATLIICCGIPGSGKSTWAKKQVSEFDYEYISRDYYRALLWDGDINHYFVNEKEVEELFYSSIWLHLVEGDTVIADATHLTDESRHKLLSRCHIKKDDEGYFIQEGFKRISVTIYLKIFDTDLETCIERNNKRTGFEYVPEDRIIKMFNYKEFPKEVDEDGMVLL